MMKLNEMEINKTCKIVRINCKGDIKKKVIRFGYDKNGTKITPVLISPSGDPKAFDIRGTLIAIREDDTKLIEIKNDLIFLNWFYNLKMNKIKYEKIFRYTKINLFHKI